MRYEAAEPEDDLGLEAAMLGRWRWTPEDVAVPVGFNPSLDPGQLGVGEQFLPPTQVQGGLRRLRRERDGQRCHRRSVASGESACNDAGGRRTDGRLDQFVFG